MPIQPGRTWKRGARPESLEPFLRQWRAVVVPVKAHEKEEQAWQRYLKNHPEDIHADVRIFHIC